MLNMPSLVGRYVKLEQHGSVWQGLCPFHKDKDTMSFTVYPSDAYCFGCRRYFSPITFLTEYLHIGMREARRMLGEVIEELPQFKPQRKLDQVPLDVITTWHSMLKHRRDYFHSRLFTDETIDREMWGWTGSRYSIPVWDRPGKKCLAARLRRGSEDEKVKYIGYKDCNEPQLYNWWFVEDFYKSYPDIIKTCYIFFGEFDSALASQDGFPAVSPTNGQNTWESDWDSLLQAYNVIIVPDRKEYLRGFQVASHFPGHSTVVQWPVEGDYNDYNKFRMDGGTPEDFLCNIVGNACQPEFSIECFYS